MKAELAPFVLAARKYRAYPGNPERVYRALCHALSDRIGEVDWDAFGDDDWRIVEPMAETEGVAPLLYWKLKHWLEGGQGAAHAKLLYLVERLAPAYYETLAHNTVLLQELERILAAFEKAGIAVLVLKGAALAQTVYEDIGLRPMNDIDLLVQPSTASLAQGILETAGYGSTAPEIFKGFNRNLSSHIHLGKGDTKEIYVELHWNLFSGRWDRREPPPDWFWESRKPLVAAGGDTSHPNAFAMGTEAALLYLSAHLTLKHGGKWNRLLWFYDLYLLLGEYQEQICWETVFRKAAEFRWEHALAQALLQTGSRFSLGLTGRVEEQLASLTRRDATPIRQNVLIPELHTLDTWGFLRYLQWSARFRMIFGLIFPSAAYMRWRYQPHPDLILPLYYPYRWGILLRDNWRAFNARRRKA